MVGTWPSAYHRQQRGGTSGGKSEAISHLSEGILLANFFPVTTDTTNMVSDTEDLIVVNM